MLITNPHNYIEVQAKLNLATVSILQMANFPYSAIYRLIAYYILTNEYGKTCALAVLLMLVFIYGHDHVSLYCCKYQRLSYRHVHNQRKYLVKHS